MWRGEFIGGRNSWIKRSTEELSGERVWSIWGRVGVGVHHSRCQGGLRGCAGANWEGGAALEGEYKKFCKGCWLHAQGTWNRFPLRLSALEVPLMR